MCVRERERENRERKCVCVCERERENRERKCVCVCVCERERENRERKCVCVLTSDSGERLKFVSSSFVELLRMRNCRWVC